MLSDLVYDVGMNNGDDTAFYLSLGFRVVAIEADPSLAALARERFRNELASRRLVLLNVGIGERAGEAEFWICERTNEWNSFDRAIASRDNAPHHSITIATRQFASVLQEFGVPHYLKIDIEGQDRRCLTELGSISQAELPQYLSWENDGDQGFEQLATAHELGYSRFKLIDQATYGPLLEHKSFSNLVDSATWRAVRQFRRFRLPGARALQSRFTHRGRLERQFGRPFPMGSSGPWGERMPGRWYGFKEATAQLKQALDQHRARSSSPAYSFWCDWHAAL